MSVIIKPKDNIDPAIYELLINIPKNVKDKLLIARNVLVKLHSEGERINSSNFVLQEIHDLTGADSDTLRVVVTKGLKVRTFREWLDQYTIEKPFVVCMSYTDLRSIITSMYLKSSILVTRSKLLKFLQCVNKYYTEKKLVVDLKQNGFVLKRLPGTKTCIVVEKTDQLMQRMEYLINVRDYRRTGREFVYIFMDSCPVLVASSSGLIKVTEGIKNFIHRLDDWFLNDLLPFLPANCVLIIYSINIMKHTIKLDYSSSKADLCEWLTQNEIIHDPTSTKADLYLLVKKFRGTKLKQKYVFEDMFKSLGHSILWCSTSLRSLNFFYKDDHVLRAINNTKSSKSVLESISLYSWKTSEYLLINDEKNIYIEDLALESVIDTWHTLANNGQCNNEDFEDCNDVLQLKHDLVTSLIL